MGSKPSKPKPDYKAMYHSYSGELEDIKQANAMEINREKARLMSMGMSTDSRMFQQSMQDLEQKGADAIASLGESAGATMIKEQHERYMRNYEREQHELTTYGKRVRGSYGPEAEYETLTEEQILEELGGPMIEDWEEWASKEYGEPSLEPTEEEKKEQEREENEQLAREAGVGGGSGTTTTPNTVQTEAQSTLKWVEERG